MGFFTASSRIGQDIIRLRYLFVNVFFVGTADNWVLVDGGLKGCANSVISTAERFFGKNNPPKAIILTHGHFDHVGAFPSILKKWNVPVYATRKEMPFLTGQQSYPSPDPTVGKGLMALLSFSYPKKPIDLRPHIQELPADGSVPFMPGWRWIATPGHTPGHMSLFRDEDRALITGDAFVTTKQESFFSVLTQHQKVYGPPSYFTPDWIAAKKSVETLAALNPSLAATGHGLPMSGDKLTRQLQTLADGFEVLAVPAQGKYV